MSDYFVGEIRLFSFDYAPQDWHICDGSLLPIQGNQALYALLGTQFGGDGHTNFALPDFRGRVPVGVTTYPTNVPQGATRYQTGNKGGSETVALTTAQVPPHNHTVKVNTTTGAALASNPPNYLSSSGPDNTEKVFHNVYSDFTAPGIPLKSDSISNTGGGAVHNNMQPSTVMNFCIATQGLFPARN
jgi:microcystin-dependent protein